MEHREKANQRKAGEMFTASILKRITPFNQFLFSFLTSFAVMLLGKYLWQSEELMNYAASFGVVFFVMFNPWLSLLRSDSKKYFILSMLLYFLIVLLLYGFIYLWTGATLGNSLEIKVTLITTTFYILMAYAVMSGIKFLFINQSDGGI